MGKGLYLSIQNGSTHSIGVSYDGFQCVYQNGEEGSDFGPIQGLLAPGHSFGGQSGQYIEADASVGCWGKDSTFAMTLKVDQVTLVVGFSEINSTWYVDPPATRSDSPIEVYAAMQPKGAQYECVVTLKDAVGLNSSNWMSGLNDRQRLCDVLLPGTHDTGTYAYSGSNINDIPNRFVQDQDHRSDFLTQLRNGIRYFDLRVRKFVDGHFGDNLRLFHGSGSVTSVYLKVSLGHALEAVSTFLEENPTEVVIVNIGHEDKQCEPAKTDIGPDDIQGYIDHSGISWVAGHIDFQRIKDERWTKGLGDLNQDSNFSLETENPRLTGRKLDYDHLVVGDVRGKALLLLSSMPDYERWSSNIAALDWDGIFTHGIYNQNNYDAPEYREKKKNIIDGAKGKALQGGVGTQAPIQENQYSINYLSAASSLANPASSPVSFALTINAGMQSRNYETDDYTSTSDRSPSLKTLLLPGGELYEWNLQRREQGLRGLCGVMAGDFMLCPQQWYEDFWGNGMESRRGIVANPNSKDYAVDDHLTRLIWSQNQLVNPRSPSQQQAP